MTPSQEAKEYAVVHGFTLHTFGKRVAVSDGRCTTCGDSPEFSGYPAALNHMRRIVSERRTGSLKASVGVQITVHPFHSALRRAIEFGAISRKRAQRMRKAFNKARNLGRYERDSHASGKPWLVSYMQRVAARCSSRKEAIAYVRSELAGQRGVTVQYV